ncbi:hypothetical protein MUK42_26155 [Musa troglodytarum]|uniref:Uncharacterized protein n=1 Tax=Musa troglodytarum TaxID=320322 RepID=A0A9E7I9U4_9LILI|nr:hypothetical protein MUK42_26155 [Musa troglodytarum]
MEGDRVPVRFRESRSSAVTLSGCSRPPQETPGHLQKLLVPFHEDRTPEGSMAMEALKERRARSSKLNRQQHEGRNWHNTLRGVKRLGAGGNVFQVQNLIRVLVNFEMADMCF